MDYERFLVRSGQKVRLQRYHPGFTSGYKDKEDAHNKLQQDIELMAALQDKLYASRQCAVLIIFQGIDTSGKDSAIKHVMSGLNPQGVQVSSFKEPSREELSHDFLWRAARALPGRGYIGIFNRSYYEDVLVVRVHRQALAAEGVAAASRSLWKERYQDINNFERHLARSGTHILKFFLHLSRGEQRRRLLERIEDRSKNWKFSASDIQERGYWPRYQHAFEEMLSHTSTESAPWYIIPADHKWFTRVAVADVVVSKLESLKLRYPQLDSRQRAELAQAARVLKNG